MELTGDQKDFFETFGFLVFRQLLSPDEVATMLRESDDIMEEVRGGSAFDGRKWQAVQPFFERRPFLHSLTIDPRILGIAEGLLGPDIFLDVTEGNLHVGDTPWHGGGNDAEILPHVKIGFYLEPLTKETGALRFIPGSHKGDFSERLNRISQRIDDADARVWGVPLDEVPSYAVETTAGRCRGIQGEHVPRGVRRTRRTAPARHQLLPEAQDRGANGTCCGRTTRR